MATYAIVTTGIVTNMIIAGVGDTLPTGAVDVTLVAPQPAIGWAYDGTVFTAPVVTLSQAQAGKIAAIDGLKNKKLKAGITYLGKTFNCSDMDVGGIDGKLENLKRENAGTARTITGVSLTNPVVITSVAHNFRNLDRTDYSGVGGTVELTGIHPIGNITTDTYELTGVDGTAWTAFTSGGSATLVCRWTSIDNTINDYSSAQFTALVNAMNNFNDLCFNVARMKKNEVSALTSTASVNAYDITIGWPPNIY